MLAVTSRKMNILTLISWVFCGRIKTQASKHTLNHQRRQKIQQKNIHQAESVAFRQICHPSFPRVDDSLLHRVSMVLIL